MKLSLSDTQQLARAALASLGFVPQAAATVAEHLLDCELRGFEYGGLARILSIADRLSERPVPPDRIRVVRETDCSAQVDGSDCIGYLVAAQAVELALRKADSAGIAVVGANNTWYTGMLSYYAEMAVSAGMVAILASNATPWVAPFGGTAPRFGTNPICVGFPSEGAPVIWDIGVSEIIHAEAVMAERTQQALQPGLAYDASGAETTDPAAALQGAFVNWGGHRGSGLGVVVQLLGVLAGSPIFPGDLRGFGFFAIVVRPDLLVDPREFRAEVTAYANVLRATPAISSDAPVRAPFERSAALRAQRQALGMLDIDDVIYQKVMALARRSSDRTL